jgi:hypothetical protein
MSIMRIKYFLLLLCLVLPGTFLSAALGDETQTVRLEAKEISRPWEIGQPFKPSLFMLGDHFPDYIMAVNGKGQDIDMGWGGEMSPKSTFAALVKKEPESYQCRMPVRGVFRLASRSIPFALDSTDLEKTGYDRLFIDANGNGDLTDDGLQTPFESPKKEETSVTRVEYVTEEAESGDEMEVIEEEEIEMVAPEDFTNCSFPTLSVSLSSGGAKYSYRFLVNVQSYKTDDDLHTNVALYPAICRVGEIKLGGKTREVALFDSNCNGRFDDGLIPVQEGSGTPPTDYVWRGTDKLVFDPDPQKLDYQVYEPMGNEDKHFVSRSLMVDGRLYDLHVTPGGDRLSLEPSDAPLGSVVMKKAHFSAVFSGPAGTINIRGKAGESCPLPAGPWRVLSYTINLSASKEWEDMTMIYGGASDGGPDLTVQKGMTTDLRFGPPLKGVMKVGHVVRQGKDDEHVINLEASIHGACGALIQQVMVKGKSPEAPNLTITNGKGEIVTEDAFEYG